MFEEHHHQFPLAWDPKIKVSYKNYWHGCWCHVESIQYTLQSGCHIRKGISCRSQAKKPWNLENRPWWWTVILNPQRSYSQDTFDQLPSDYQNHWKFAIKNNIIYACVSSLQNCSAVASKLEEILKNNTLNSADICKQPNSAFVSCLYSNEPIYFGFKMAVANSHHISISNRSGILGKQETGP